MPDFLISGYKLTMLAIAFHSFFTYLDGSPFVIYSYVRVLVTEQFTDAFQINAFM